MMTQCNYLVILLTLGGIVFDSQPHGADYWLILISTQTDPNPWMDRVAIFSASLLFFIIVSRLHVCRVDLLFSWIIFALLLTFLNMLIYLNPSTQLTYFLTFLVNACAPMTNLFLVSILMSNNGNAVSNLIVTGFSYCAGASIWRLEIDVFSSRIT